MEAEEHDTLDQWENDLANVVFSMKEEVEVSLITLEEMASVLDKNGILPVVRVRFRAANGRIREGNVLIAMENYDFDP